MDHCLHSGGLQYGKTLVGKSNRIADFVEVVRQEFVPEIPGCTVNRPWPTRLFIKTDTKAPTLLAQVTLTPGVHHVRVLPIALVYLRDIVGNNVLMLHGMQRQIDPSHGANFPCP